MQVWRRNPSRAAAAACAVAVALSLLAGSSIGAHATAWKPVRAAALEPRVPSLLAFGDSIAAGEGTGPSGGFPDNAGAYPNLTAARLGVNALNFAASGATSSSVLTEQLPQSEGYLAQHPAVQPRLITLTVGANDIDFVGCLESIGFGLIGANAPDPCSGSTFTDHIATLRTNLTAIVGRVQHDFPGVPIAVTRYFDMFPVAVTTQHSSVCSLMPYLWALHEAQQGHLASLGWSIVNRSFDSKVASFQGQLHDHAVAVLNTLNDAIATGAGKGATVVPLDFTGHDFCADYPGAGTGWVFAPAATGHIEVHWSALSRTRDFAFAPADTCAPQTPAPGCNEVAPIQSSGTKSFGEGFQKVTVDYRVNVALNGFPHLTPAGNAQVAGVIAGALQPHG
jgi:GDSL-like lipase/acylhydrolase family protein